MVDGTVLVEETATNQRFRLHGLDAEFDSHGVVDGLPPISVSGMLDTGVAANPAFAAASFALTLTNAEGRQQLNWKLQGIPLAAAEPWLRLAVPGAGISGGLFGQGTASWPATTANPLNDCSTSGTLVLQSLDVTAPELAGDHLRLANVELPWRLTSQAGGVTIEDLQLKSDVGRFAARGTLDPTSLSLSARHDLQFQGEIDLAPLAAMLPHLLRIRGDTTITAGRLELAGRTQPIAEGESLSGVLRAAGLAATNAGRPLAWNQPVDATFDLRRENGDVRLESLKCNSEFLTVNAAGTAQQLTANATFDLDRLAAQLGQFVELKGIDLAGTGTAHVDWQQTGGDQFAAAANGELVQLRVGLGDGKVLAEPRLAIKVAADGMLDRRDAQTASRGDGPSANRRRGRSARRPTDRGGRLHRGGADLAVLAAGDRRDFPLAGPRGPGSRPIRGRRAARARWRRKFVPAQTRSTCRRPSCRCRICA